MVEYLVLDFNFGSMQEIFESIRTSNANGKKLIENYQKTFSEHFASISQIIFKQDRFTIYGLWGIAALVLGLTKNNDLILAGNMLEEKALSFLGERGPRIDYKLVKHGVITSYSIHYTKLYDSHGHLRYSQGYQLYGSHQNSVFVHRHRIHWSHQGQIHCQEVP